MTALKLYSILVTIQTSTNSFTDVAKSWLPADFIAWKRGYHHLKFHLKIKTQSK